MSGKKIVFLEKSHYSSHEKALALEVNLDDKFIFLYRDPRDAILSYFYFTFKRKKHVRFSIMMAYLLRLEVKQFFTLLSGNYDNVTFEDYFYTFAKNQIESWREIYFGWTHKPNTLTLCYEDLLLDMKGTLQQVAAFCDFRYCDAKATEIISKWDVENTRTMFNDHNKNPDERMVRTGGNSEWRALFDQKTINLFNHAFNDIPEVLTNIQLGQKELKSTNADR